MRRPHNLAIAFATATALASLVAATDARAGDAKIARADLIASNCFNCHGFEGVSVGIIDSLEGIKAKGMIKKMMEFRNGSKPSTIMTRIAKGYTEAEIEAMAHYFEKLTAGR